jgi:hypothetical protein
MLSAAGWPMRRRAVARSEVVHFALTDHLQKMDRIVDRDKKR